MLEELQKDKLFQSEWKEESQTHYLSSNGRGIWVNDSQSQLNPTRVRHLCQPNSVDEIIRLVAFAKTSNSAISVSGGKHAMGGQQFGHENLHLDMSDFNRIIQLDSKAGLVTVEAGIKWPKLIHDLRELQSGLTDGITPWVIREKQTGVDSVSIGGSLSANIHGRGLRSRPFVDSIEAFELVDHRGEVQRCSRSENRELFSLAIGGYGLFGIVATVTLRLVRRFKVQRQVSRILAMDSVTLLNQHRESGFVFGDCQFAIDMSGNADEHPAILPCYRPVSSDIEVTPEATSLSPEDWASLYRLSRTDKRQAFELFSQHYLGTDGQVYWSDTHQLSSAFSGYREAVNPKQGTEMITEIYLDHDKAIPCLESIREDLASRKADVTYGTIRLIEADHETFLPWARRRSVCIVANLHCPGTASGIKKTKQHFRAILDRALNFDGSFYLTYHRWALKHQIEAAYPQISEFFALKKVYDPNEIFQSNWYRHYRDFWPAIVS